VSLIWSLSWLRAIDVRADLGKKLSYTHYVFPLFVIQLHTLNRQLVGSLRLVCDDHGLMRRRPDILSRDERRGHGELRRGCRLRGGLTVCLRVDWLTSGPRSVPSMAAALVEAKEGSACGLASNGVQGLYLTWTEPFSSQASRFSYPDLVMNIKYDFHMLSSSSTLGKSCHPNSRTPLPHTSPGRTCSFVSLETSAVKQRRTAIAFSLLSTRIR
jgi:hypothetical protein